MSSGAAPSIVADCSTISLEKSQQAGRPLAVTQSLAEAAVPAQPRGASREAFPDYLNNSVMGSTFTRYKTAVSGHLGLRPAFTTELLPVASLAHQIVPSLVGYELADQDFAALTGLETRPGCLRPESGHADISDGLDSADTDGPGTVP